MVECYHETVCHAEKWFIVFNVKAAYNLDAYTLDPTKSEWSEPLWTDTSLKGGIGVRELIST